jgi:hypothetical protein
MHFIEQYSSLSLSNIFCLLVLRDTSRFIEHIVKTGVIKLRVNVTAASQSCIPDFGNNDSGSAAEGVLLTWLASGKGSCGALQ